MHEINRPGNLALLNVEVYQRLAASEVDHYGALKAQLLKRFRLTEGGYRKKFKNPFQLRLYNVYILPVLLYGSDT